MVDREGAHQHFIEFVTAFYRDADCELQYFESDPDHPIAFDVQIDAMTLTIGYDPAATNAHLFVHCVFGTLPPHGESAAMRRMLECSLAIARDRNATYCIDSGTNQVAYYLRRSTTDIDMAAFQDELVSIAREAAHWRRADVPGRAIDQLAAPLALPQADSPAPWFLLV